MNNEILNQIVQLREKAHNHGEEVAKLIGAQPSEIPVGVFGMIFNKLTLGLELLSYYYDAWEKAIHTKYSSVEEAKQENAQRVILIQKMIFLDAMSSIEFCLKEYIKKSPQKISSFTDRIYLRRIMKQSETQGVISNPEFTLWEGTIELRNALVHNNGVSEKTRTYNYPSCNLNLQKGKMIQGNLKLFPNLIDWLLDSIKYWIHEMHKK